MKEYFRQMTTYVEFREGNYYTHFSFGQRDEDGEHPEDIRLIVTDYDGAEQVVDCSLTTDEMEYLAKRMLEVVEYQRELLNKVK